MYGARACEHTGMRCSCQHPLDNAWSKNDAKWLISNLCVKETTEIWRNDFPKTSLQVSKEHLNLGKMAQEPSLYTVYRPVTPPSQIKSSAFLEGSKSSQTLLLPLTQPLQ